MNEPVTGVGSIRVKSSGSGTIATVDLKANMEGPLGIVINPLIAPMLKNTTEELVAKFTAAILQKPESRWGYYGWIKRYSGWQISFRTHSASTLVEPSLKFDISIIGLLRTMSRDMIKYSYIVYNSPVNSAQYTY